jgi:hypothetical protein
MKIVEVNELKSGDCKAPFYCIIDKTKITQADPRACGCATLAMLNLILVFKERLGIENSRSAFVELKLIQEQIKECKNSVRPEALTEFIDKHPTFNSCRMLVMNPNRMDEDVFLKIFLRRLVEGNLVLAMLELPTEEGEPAKHSLNHAAFIHSEKGEVYFDGLAVDLNFLLSAFYFSKPTTLIFFTVNPGGANERR